MQYTEFIRIVIVAQPRSVMRSRTLFQKAIRLAAVISGDSDTAPNLVGTPSIFPF